MFGFESVKDALEIVLVPAVGGLVALLWPAIQMRDRRMRFERLIARELEEVGPPPTFSPSASVNWTEHQTKSFVHQRILSDATQNRDFILALDPTLTYLVTQLWDARRTSNSDQWMYYLGELADRFGGRVAERHAEWSRYFNQVAKQASQ